MDQERRTIELPRVQEMLSRRCRVCGDLLAEQFAHGWLARSDSFSVSLVLAMPDAIGFDICHDCLQRQPKKSHLTKKWASFCKQVGPQEGSIWRLPPELRGNLDAYESEYSVENIRGCAELICDSQPEPPVPEIPGAGGGSQVGIPAEAYMGNKQQQTFHFRHGKSAQKTYCDVKGSNIDLVVIDDDNVKIGCSHLSQGGWLEGPEGTCRYRSNLFVTRKCIFWGV